MYPIGFVNKHNYSSIENALLAYATNPDDFAGGSLARIALEAHGSDNAKSVIRAWTKARGDHSSRGADETIPPLRPRSPFKRIGHEGAVCEAPYIMEDFSGAPTALVDPPALEISAEGIKPSIINPFDIDILVP